MLSNGFYELLVFLLSPFIADSALLRKFLLLSLAKWRKRRDHFQYANLLPYLFDFPLHQTKFLADLCALKTLDLKSFEHLCFLFLICCFQYDIHNVATQLSRHRICILVVSSSTHLSNRSLVLFVDATHHVLHDVELVLLPGCVLTSRIVMPFLC